MSVDFCFIKNKLSLLIWQTSLPMVGAISALLLYDLLESSLISQSGTTTLTALGFTLPLTTAITAIAIGLSVCSNNSVIKAACLDQKSVINIISKVLLSTVLIVSALSLAANLANEFLLSFLGNNIWAEEFATAEKSVLILKQQAYMTARYSSWIFLAVIWQINSILRALGKSVLASSLMFSWLIIKTILALLLLSPTVSNFTDTFTALAYVHIISDVTIALISFIILKKSMGITFPKNYSLKRQLAGAKLNTIMVVIQQLITPISMALLTIIAATIDYNYVAAFALILRMEVLFLLIPMVLTTSIPAIVGSNYWSGRKDRVLQTYLITFSFIIFIQVLVATSLYLYSANISAFFCSETSISNYIIRYFTWVSWAYLVIGCIMVYQSSLNAKGKTIQAFILGFSHRIILLLPFSYLGSIYTLEDDFYQGMLFGHVITAPITVNDHFYQGILSGHIISGFLMLAFLYKGSLSKKNMSLKNT